MADFNVAFRYVLQDEDSQLSGAVTPDPVTVSPDPNEPYKGRNALARFGINSHWFPEAVSEGFYQMDRDRALNWAQALYKHRFFSPIWGYSILSQDIANKFCDLAVNEGISQATKLMQRACNELLAGVAIGYLPLTIDGEPGPKTVEAINDSDPQKLLAAFKEQARNFYCQIAQEQNWSTRKLAALLARVAR